MEILTVILALLVACGVCRAILEHLGISTGQQFFNKPFELLARLVLLPLELVFYLIGRIFFRF